MEKETDAGVLLLTQTWVEKKARAGLSLQWRGLSQVASSWLAMSFVLDSWMGHIMSWFFVSVGQSIGVLASASVLPMNIQD